MLTHLSRYEYVIEKWYYSRSFNLHINIQIGGPRKEKFNIIVYIYTVIWDTNNFVNVNDTPRMGILICRVEPILQSFTDFDWEY